MEIPSKKRRVEEKPDFGKCIICQEETRESLVQSVSEESYANVLYFAHSRTAYGENEFAAISRLLEGVSAEELRQNNVSLHAKYRKRLVNSAMLKRAEASSEKAAASQILQSFHVLLEGRLLLPRQTLLYPLLSMV